MKIEAGKYYKTRGGHKAFIYCVDAPGDHPIHGRIEKHPFDPLVERWKLGGVYLTYSDSEFVSGFDLVSEWEEPRPKLKAWIHSDSRVVKMEIPDIDLSADYIRMPHLDEP